MNSVVTSQVRARFADALDRIRKRGAGLLRIVSSSKVRLDDDPSVQQERAWYRSFHPKDGLDYSEMLKYASSKYEEIKAINAAVDKKAEWLFTVAAATGYGIYHILKEGKVSLWWGAPSLLFIGLAILGTIRARIPGARPTPMAVRDAIAQMNENHHEKAWLCANMQLAISKLGAVNLWKSRQLENAMFAFLIGLALALLIF